MLLGMSRNSPSGPIEATDHKNILFALSTSNPGAAGEFIVETEGQFAGLVANTPTDPSFLSGSLVGPMGYMTRKGRIGFARLAAGVIAPLSGAVSLQWEVNNVKKGNVVDVPFTNVLPANPTPADMPSAIVDFGDVEWLEGDFVQLVVTAGVLTGGGSINFVLAWDYDLEAGRPRA